jgi:hypothetical protein
MSANARQASLAFTRLVSDEPSSSRFDYFLEHGMESAAPSWRDRHVGLGKWHGLSALKASFRARVEAPQELPVFLTSRTSQLMRLAAHLLFLRCRRLLTTDLEWPA